MQSLGECRFLVVDDMNTMRKMVALVLKSCGVTQIAEAPNGRVALEMIEAEALKKTPFHFVISDWNMPEMQGIEVLKRCRLNEIHNNMAFIFVTAEIEGKHHAEAEAAGVDRLVSKPITVDVCKKVLTEIFEKRFKK